MKTYLVGLLVFLLSIFINGVLISQELDDYLRIAASNNQELKAKFYEYQAALQRVHQVGALPDPQLSIGYFIEPMERYMGNQVAEISLMQMFPWFGTLGAAKEEAALMAKAKYEEYNEAKSMLYYEVKVSWYNLLLSQKEILINEENIETFKRLEEIAITRFIVGGGGSDDQINNSQRMGTDDSVTGYSSSMSGMNMPEQTTSSTGSTPRDNMGGMGSMSGSGRMIDVLRIQMETNELENRLVLLKDREKTKITQFNQLLNRPSNEAVMIPDNINLSELPLTITEKEERIRLYNPMLKMLDLEAEAYRAEQKMNRRMGYPMIGIGLQYDIFQSRIEEEGMMKAQNMLMPMISVSIPIWRKKYNASVREAQFLEKAVIEQHLGLYNELVVNYEKVLDDFRDAERRMHLYRKQTQLGQQILDILIVEYATNGSNYEEVLRMQSELLDFRLKTLNAIIDGNIAVAILEQLMGR